MLPLGPILFLLAVAPGGGPAVRVSLSGAAFGVMASRAPLSAVLEEIGRQTGTRVAYDGAPPRILVSCDFVAATPAEAFLRALEGLGVNYVLFGGTVAHPQSLLVSAPAGSPHAVPAPLAPEVASTDAMEEDSLPLAEPPPDGAAHGRFGRQQDPPGTSAEGGSPTSASSAAEAAPIQPLELPQHQRQPSAAQADGDGQRTAGAGGMSQQRFGQGNRPH